MTDWSYTQIYDHLFLNYFLITTDFLVSMLDFSFALDEVDLLSVFFADVLALSSTLDL